MKWTTDKFLNEVLQHYVDSGDISITRLKTNHFKITAKNGLVTHCAATPSDYRAALNVKARIKRLLRGQEARTNAVVQNETGCGNQRRSPRA
jgi:hypothetical protein